MFSLVSRFSSLVFQMGWEVFYQATLISTRLTELMSKRKNNCNIIIMGPIDYGLHEI